MLCIVLYAGHTPLKRKAVVRQGYLIQLQHSKLLGRLQQGLLETRISTLAWTTYEDPHALFHIKKEGGRKK